MRSIIGGVVAGVVMMLAMALWPASAAQRGRVQVVPVLQGNAPLNLPYGTVVGFACTASQCYVAIQ